MQVKVTFKVHISTAAAEGVAAVRHEHVVCRVAWLSVVFVKLALDCISLRQHQAERVARGQRRICTLEVKYCRMYAAWTGRRGGGVVTCFRQGRANLPLSVYCAKGQA